jgi:hypothetical protein
LMLFFFLIIEVGFDLFDFDYNFTINLLIIKFQKLFITFMN